MGGVVEGEDGIIDKTSPRRSAIEKAQAELRLKYETRDKTKRELEFLLEGGNPLELECANAALVSVHSTSFTDQHPDQLVTSEAKGSFAFTASLHGDSAESSDRPGTNPCEPNTADNLLLFSGREVSECNRSKLHPTRSNIVSSEKLSNTDDNRRTGEHGDSAALGLPRKSYKRRYRSRPNRDGTRSSSTDVNPTRGSHGSSLPSRHGPRDEKRLLSDVENQIISSNSYSKPTSPADGALPKTGLIDSQKDIKLDGIKNVESTKDLTVAFPLNAASDAIACETPLDDQCNLRSLSSVVKTPIRMGSDEPETIQVMEGMASEDIECQPGVTAVEVENKTSSCQINGFIGRKGDMIKSNARNSASCGVKGLDSESSCTQTSRSIDGNNSDTEMCTKMRNIGSNGQIKNQLSVPDKTAILEGDESVKEKKEPVGMDISTLLNVESSFACQSQQENGVKLQPEEELNRSVSALENELKDQINFEGMEACRRTGPESGRKSVNPLGDETGPNNENSCTVRHQDSIDVSLPDLPGGVSLTKTSTVPFEAQTSPGSDLKLVTEIDEDSILKEAQIIEAKRKRITELSVATAPKRNRLKSHWDYVLEEMAWLANDFAQERVWKVAAAAQISYRAAFTCHMRKQENNFHLEAKKVAHTVAKSVMKFWHLVEETSKLLDQQSQRDDEHSVQAYAVRFQRYNNCDIAYNQTEVPRTPDRVSDMGIMDPSWKDNLTEENLFYTVLPETMETYRSSVESHVAQFQRINTGILEEVETSAFNAAADFESQNNAYEEEGRETNTYGLSMAFEDSKSSRFGQKKQKHLINAPHGVRSHEVAIVEKRPGGNLDASITKRVRTASRRVVSPFSAGTSAFLQVPNKTDASSGDTTNSFQDDQSTLRGGSHAPYSLEVESAGKFEKQLSIESAEVLLKHKKKKKKKKKKAKHLNAAYEPRWQVDPTFQDEQFHRDHSRKGHHLKSNCSSGLLGQPMAKKQKTMRQSQDSSFENITPIGGSVPSPAASQMSNMSNPNKFIKMLGGRDRGRKPKGLKMPAGQPCSGSSWTLFEDQNSF